MPDTRVDNRKRAAGIDASRDDPSAHRFLANWTAALEAHSLPMGGRALRRAELAAVDLGRPSFGGNVATVLAPVSPDDLPISAAALDDFFGFGRRDRFGSVALFSPWPALDFQPFGWELVDEQQLMRRPPGGHIPPDPSGLHIEPVRDATALRGFERAMVRGFELAELDNAAPGSLFAPAILSDSKLRLWVGWIGGQPVSAAAAYIHSGIVNVTLVGTVPEARRRGYGAALTWRALLADPALPAMLIATGAGRPVYEGMGFLPLFRFAVWTQDRPSGGET